MAGNAPMEESLIQLLKCVVCMEQEDVLKALPCQHTICLCCVIQLTIRENRFKCPTCNKEHAVPNGGLDELPNSLLSQQIADIVNARQQVTPSSAGTHEKKKTVPTKASTHASSLLTAKGGFGFVPNTTPSTLLAAKGAFGIVPNISQSHKKSGSQKDVKTSPKDTKSTRKKQSTQTAAPTNKVTDLSSRWVPKEADVLRLKKELQQVYDRAARWCRRADEILTQRQRVITALTENAGKARSPIKKYQEKACAPCAQKAAAVDKGAAEKEAELRNILEKAKIYTDSVEVAVTKATEHSRKLSTARKLSGTAIAEAQDICFQLKQLNGDVRRLDLDLDCGKVIRSGDCVRLKPYSLLWKDFDRLLKDRVSHSSLGIFLQTETESRGHMVPWLEVQEQTARVIFPEHPGCRRSPAIVEKALTKRRHPFFGDKVQIKSSVTRLSSLYSSTDGTLTNESVGVLKEMYIDEGFGGDCRVEVDFPEYKNWVGVYSEIELVAGCPFQIGDKVRVNSNIQEPHRGWGGVNASSVGKISSIDGPDITVNFTECNNWVGSTDDLELVREIRVGDRVQVKLSVKCTGRQWKDVTHSDVGVLTAIVCDYSMGFSAGGYPLFANVDFPNHKKCECKLGDIELARYQTPGYDIGDSEEQAAAEPTAADDMFDLNTALRFMHLFGQL